MSAREAGSGSVLNGADWEIRQTDCLDPLRGLAALPDLSVDVCITDPPYAEHVHTAQRRGQMSRERQGSERAAFNRKRELGFAHLDPNLRRAVAKELARVVWRWVVVFSDLESHHLWREDLELCGLEHIRVGIWRKEGSTPQFTGDRPAVAAEAMEIAERPRELGALEIAHPPGRKRWNGGGGHAYWSYPIVLDRGGTGARVHTTQKPVELMEALVRQFSEPGEVVIDPFAGSGTTGVACRRLGRRFLGWERDPAYAVIAEQRIGRAVEQCELFSESRAHADPHRSAR
jgi:site-specific DNA-methyltransferase (adenine-specific)